MRKKVIQMLFNSFEFYHLFLMLDKHCNFQMVFIIFLFLFIEFDYLFLMLDEHLNLSPCRGYVSQGQLCRGRIEKGSKIFCACHLFLYTLELNLLSSDRITKLRRILEDVVAMETRVRCLGIKEEHILKVYFQLTRGIHVLFSMSLGINQNSLYVVTHLSNRYNVIYF